MFERAENKTFEELLKEKSEKIIKKYFDRLEEARKSGTVFEEATKIIEEENIADSKLKNCLSFEILGKMKDKTLRSKYYKKPIEIPKITHGDALNKWETENDK